MRIPGVMIGLLLAIAASGPGMASNPLGRYAQAEEFLPGELAFRATMMSGRSGEIIVRWEMPDGYYLYRDKMKFEAGGGLRISRISAPTGLVKDDAFLGKVEIYRDAVSVVIDRAAAPGGTLKVAYQGCAEDKICYPPMTRVFTVPGGQCAKSAARGVAC